MVAKNSMDIEGASPVAGDRQGAGFRKRSPLVSWPKILIPEALGKEEYILEGCSPSKI